MSDIVNPYESPETAVVPDKAPTGQGSLTETMLIQLKGASPWLRFVGVLGFIGAGFLILIGVVVLSIASFFSRSFADIDPFSGSVGAAFWVFIALFWFILGVLLVLPSLFMYRFGEKIRGYLRTGAEQELELAFKNNRLLWKSVGIICIVQLAFFPLSMIGSIIAIAFSVI
ncbi:MAG: hypothetical protein LBQ94_02180 [Treponema sp.]|jgi:uncharacterized membrane protein|nr:hypothetical protein [Treponema sp.]